RRRVERRYSNDGATQRSGDPLDRRESDAQTRKTSWPTHGRKDIDLFDRDVGESECQLKMLEQTLTMVMNFAHGERGKVLFSPSYGHARIICGGVDCKNRRGLLRGYNFGFLHCSLPRCLWVVGPGFFLA